ncbi:hypothetical protein KY289_016481 [Solanum tuberosum]|uniref:Hero resistance protein 2 homologue n=1 Tax=Solanum tuberosum TaxID=4113 RepID=M1C982_SOLTU|nr:hypothetical protein KY289_016481 [Solanum tuberosum]
MDDGFLFMNLLLGRLYDLFISNVYLVSLIKKEIGMVKESFEFLRSSFGKGRQTLDDTSGVVKDCWVRTLDVAYETEHVISSILVRDKALSHLIFSLPSVADKIKLIVAEVTSLQLEDKNGNDPLDAKSSDKPIESTSSSFVEVLREILHQVTGSEGNKSEDDLAEKLRRALLDKRYLIVLDDVWDIATGEMLIACFPKDKRRNRIILTSRSMKVGLQVKCHSDPRRLQFLTPEKSWDLSEKRVFGEGRCLAELSYVGHQIVVNCKGLSLAVVLIARVTVRVRKGKKKENEKDLWLKIQHNLDSFISANKNLQMMKVMQLSYDHLPYHLKSLLLYFARSQKSKRTPVSKLMQLWMAEGFVDHDIPSKSSLEEATQSYLDALISSSLIFVDHIPSKKRTWPFSGMIKVCYVHDVVHDFCSVKAKKEKFFKLINSGAPFHALDFLHRRLTVHTKHSQLHKKCVLFNSTKSSAGSKNLIPLKVRDSFFEDYADYICHTRHLKLLRVLQLRNILLNDYLIEEIGSLFYLRFLRIETLDLKVIPLLWLNLQNLETLLIRTQCSTIVLLPKILKLSKLKHISIDNMSSFFENEKDADNIMHQRNRILEAENSKLTTLSQVQISYSEGTNDALEKFTNLQHLDCIIEEPIDPPSHNDWFPKFNVLNKLESLIARYRDDSELIDQIPPPNEYHFPTSLKVLRLYGFLLRPTLLSVIVALPELEILVLNTSDFSEDKWDASKDIYQSLKTLHLENVKLSEWQVDRETFPNLEELILEYCFKLTEIPSAFGDIDTLKSIRVVQSKCELGDSAMEMRKDVEAYTGENKLHVHLSYEYSALGYEEESKEERSKEIVG